MGLLDLLKLNLVRLLSLPLLSIYPGSIVKNSYRCTSKWTIHVYFHIKVFNWNCSTEFVYKVFWFSNFAHLNNLEFFFHSHTCSRSFFHSAPHLPAEFSQNYKHFIMRTRISLICLWFYMCWLQFRKCTFNF